MDKKTYSRSSLSVNKSDFVNLLPKKCLKKYQLGDKLFSEFKYEDALETYKNSLECFKQYYIIPPRTEEENKIVSEYIYDISIKIKAISRILDTKNKKNLFNLRQLEFVVQIMIMEERYDDVLDFLNVSPEIDNMIEAEVLKYIQKIELQQINLFTNHLSDDIIYAINDCSFIFKLSSDQKKKIKKSLYEIFVKELQKLEFKTYKGAVYRTRKLEIDEIKKITSELNVYLRQVIKYNDEECVYGLLFSTNPNFFTKTVNNINMMLNGNNNYTSVINKSYKKYYL